MFLRHPFLSLATAGYLALVGWVTLSPQNTFNQDSILARLARFFGRYPETDWLTFSRIEFIANVAMFVPIGLFFVLLLGRSRWWLAVILAVGLTVGIEFAQQYIAGRVSDPRDLAANSLGAVIGVLGALILTAAKAARLGRVAPTAHTP